MSQRSGKTLRKWEVALVKAMLERKYVPQDIQAYFSRPTRSINHARISEIRDGKRHDDVKPTSQEELDAFLQAWPNIDERTGLQRHEDELLVKAREAMIAAVHIFNGAGLHFRAELFIVTSIIAWTYLLHAYYKREGIDYRYKKNDVTVKTPEGADKYWGLSHCLKGEKCPLEKGVRNNLNFLLSLRHEIEHRSTSRIDDALGAKLQACCINFNNTLKRLFGNKLTLEKRLPIALQFATFDGRQGKSLLGADLPRHIKTAIDKLHEKLTEDEWNDPRFACRVALTLKLSGNPSTDDRAVEFVKPESPKATEAEHVLLKETERPKFLPGEIVKKVQDAGYPDFKMHDHTLLWKQLKAKNPGKGFGTKVARTWYWYENWFDQVMEKLKEGWTRRKKEAPKPR